VVRPSITRRVEPGTAARRWNVGLLCGIPRARRVIIPGTARSSSGEEGDSRCWTMIPDPGRSQSDAHGGKPAPDTVMLVERIRRADPAAEAELVDRYSRGVRMIISRTSGDRSIVEDLCQDTFRIALEKIRRGDVRDPARLSGFMCSLARNIAIDRNRREPRRDSTSPPETADQAPSQLDRLLLKEQATIARQVLDELGSERDRQILFRFYVAEDSKAQICQDLGLSSLHFNRVLFRARERYRTLYEAVRSRPSPGV
jgi:RNA polymerase sigma-70 factor (ECF subfamily)